MRLGPWEIGLIFLIVLIVFGVGKLPQVGGALGKGIREFRKAQRGDLDEEEEKEEKPAGSSTKQSMQAELQAAKVRLEAAEAKLKELQESAKSGKK